MSPADPLAELLPNDHNPRAAWKPEQIEPFRASLQRFGDLGGIVRNLTTDRLVGGHKRVEVFRTSAAVHLETTEQPIDAQGTTAHGFVLVDGHRFAYREVRWSEEIEAAANLAANRWGAEWAWELVAENLHAITDPELLTLTGFPAHELANLLAAEWHPGAPGSLTEENASSGHSIHFTPAQYERVQQVKLKMAEPLLSDAAILVRLCEEYLHRAIEEG